jgi:precorrin-6Y C5,15-methyltransferase (decarboxylating)
MMPIIVIGMGMSVIDLTERQLKQIRQADILIGAKRHLDCFPDVAARKKTIDRNLKSIVDFIMSCRSDDVIVVLASGDPLFYGIGAYLSKSFGAERVVVLPNITAVAAAFSRIKESWHDATVISLHGRQQEAQFLTHLRTTDKLAVLTDPHFNPNFLAQQCLASGINDVRMCVLEQLGTDNERVSWHEPVDAVKLTFTEPNIVIFRRYERRRDKTAVLRLGLSDNQYEHERGLITKAEVRAVTLSKLKLEPYHVVWDLGAGSGSVGIESALFVSKGQIIVVEKDHKRSQQIEANMKRFNVNNMEVIHGLLPDAIDGLPQPDRVFIGGGGKNLSTIIEKACRKLQSPGVIVVNTALISSMISAIEVMEGAGLRTEMVQVQVSRSRKMPWSQRLEAENPVWIISGDKKEKPAR